jgi:hypothetical protein
MKLVDTPRVAAENIVEFDLRLKIITFKMRANHNY